MTWKGEAERSSRKWWLPSSNQISWQFQFQHKHFLPGVISASCSVSVTSCQEDTSRLCCIILVAPVIGWRCGVCVGSLVWQRSLPPSGWSQQRLAVGDLTLAWNFTCNLASNITKLLSTQQVARPEHSSSSQAAALSPASDCDFLREPATRP